MNVALSDPEQEIRQTMLSSLNENFDPYLNSPSNLRKLFLCINDSNPTVQELSLIILCRLAKINPSDIIPFLKNTLFQYLSSLNFDQFLKEKQKIEYINLLGTYIKYGADIVRPYADSIARIILKHLKNEHLTNNIIACLLQAFSQLGQVADEQIIIFLHDIIPIILQALQDKSSIAKRQHALKALISIFKNTGFVVLPYYKYPNLMDIIIGLKKTEMNQEIKHDRLRLLGALGAIDYFYFKKLNVQGKSLQLEDEQIYTELRTTFKFTIKEREIIKKFTYNPLLHELHKYYEDLILVGEWIPSKTKAMMLHLANIEQDFQRLENPENRGRKKNDQIGNANGMQNKQKEGRKEKEIHQMEQIRRSQRKSSNLQNDSQNNKKPMKYQQAQLFFGAEEVGNLE